MNKKAVILLIALSFVSSAYAEEEKHEEENRFDGSEFNSSSFKDTSFEKQDYKELRRSGAPVGPTDKENGGSSKEGSLLRKRQNDKGISAVGAGGENGPLKKSKDKLAASEKLPPITDLPSDWVPDSLSLTSNGGFSIAPFNGSPVPYDLNGHVNIQRGRP